MACLISSTVLTAQRCLAESTFANVIFGQFHGDQRLLPENDAALAAEKAKAEAKAKADAEAKAKAKAAATQV